ncbi:MAG: putative endonuclease-methyltransferase fusion protein [Thermococcales archaeon 44_46]|nr:MAG: putative endonuclease-methyltransferase fusion protein [Thermococcales archaeon 44_46]HIH73232.1 N-6 DNA methylase [Thermococcaceae archaeon]
MEDVKLLCSDLEELVLKKEIPISDVENVKSNLKSRDVKEYIEAIVDRSKPEESLRQNFFYKESPILKFLGVRGSPEVNIGAGYVDLVLKDALGRKIIVEFKRLFELRRDKLVRNELNWEEHEEQIKRYVFSEEARFVVLTNLYDWYFFSSKTVVRGFKPFYHVTFSDLVVDLEHYGDLYGLLERKEHGIKKGELDEHFFESLREWINILDEVEFEANEKEKMHLILHLINKFIFIQTLDDYGVIEFNWLYKKWEGFSDRIQLAEKHREKPKVAGKYYKSFIQKFLEEINDFFYPLYDTELFNDNLLEKIKDEPENWARFYAALARVLGFMPWQEAGLQMGITQYDYSQIDEDILGKAYETYLAEKRKEKGIYYTPKYVTQFIVEETLGKRLEELKDEIIRAIQENDFETAERLSRELFDIRVVDLASGSGSFLIKVLRALWNIYSAIVKEIREKEEQLLGKKVKNLSAIVQSKDLLEGIARMKRLFPSDERILMSQMVLRHIFAIDLDENAIEVAKMNLWRELIRLNPKAFRWDSLGENEHVLPNLSLNLVSGDSLMGFSDPKVLEGREEVKKLLELWEEFIRNPENLEVLDEIKEIKDSLREELDEEYLKLLREKLGEKAEKLNRRFVHHPLEFFMVFFNRDGSVRGGFDFIVGNPPYVRIQNLKKESPEYVEFLNKFYETSYKNYDLAIPFIERGYSLLKENGELGFIVTKKWMKAEYGEKLRKMLAETKAVRLIIDFGDEQVFRGATTYTMILVLRKAKNDKFTYAKVEELKESIEQLRAVEESRKWNEGRLSVLEVPEEELSEKPWVFLTEKERKIVEKVYGGSVRLEEVAKHIFVGVQTSADSVYILEYLGESEGYYIVRSKVTGQEHRLEKALLHPLLKGDEIKRWLIPEYRYLLLFPYRITEENGQRRADLIPADELQRDYPRIWEYLNIPEVKKTLEGRDRGAWRGRADWYAYGRRQNLEVMSVPKIVTGVLSDQARFSVDLKGDYYFVGGGNAGGYGILIKEEYKDVVPLKFLVALLNSSLLDWRLKQLSTEFEGGFYSYARRFIKDLPIKLPSTDEEKALAEEIEITVDEIIDLLKKHYEVKALWEEWSGKLGKRKLTLKKLIETWERGVGRLPQERLFFTNIRTLSDEETEYDGFELEMRDGTLRLLGREGDILMPVLELEGEEELLEHVYFSVLSLLESKRKVKTLGDILSKTEVPTIDGDPLETKRIILKIKEDANVKHLTSFMKLMKEKEIYLDALVFKLYGLSKEEARLVLESLGKNQEYIEKVLDHL